MWLVVGDVLGLGALHAVLDDAGYSVNYAASWKEMVVIAISSQDNFIPATI